MSLRAGSVAMPLVLLAVGCGHRQQEPAQRAWVVLESPDGESEAIEALGAVAVAPPAAFVGAVRTGSRLVVDVDPRASTRGVRVDVPGSCPVDVAAGALTSGATVRARLVPRLAVETPVHPGDLGYDATFVLRASLACDAETAGRFTWRQVAGEALAEARATGPRFQGRTAPLPAADAARRPGRGIVPISARAAGEVRIEATWGPGPGGEVVRRTLTLASASRSHGLPNVGVDEGVLLAGSGWTIEAAPPGAAATLESAGAFARLVPDAAGAWRLRQDAGHALTIQAGRYAETPLDCGRSGCHTAIATAALGSPMTEALRSLPAAARPCALACHATGGLAAHDGGFADLARALGAFAGETPWESLPGDLRRMGGVTCLGCHGPGAIPEASARWAVLRADVCATCHDAPPAYGHVAAWRTSRMAVSDADPAARSAPDCARCHTTSGFLAGLRAEPDGRAAPAEAGAVGIACAACHAPHSAHGAAPAGPLLRPVPVAAWAAGAEGSEASAICLPCHAPGSPDPTRTPTASAASLWAGRGGVDPATGRALWRPTVHAGPSVGCLGCHDGGPPDVDRGRSHAFRASPSQCRTCHGAALDVSSVDADLHREALALLDRLAPGAAARHALPRRLSDDARGRAIYDLLLVAEDPAAGAHNEPYARALLAAAREEVDR